MRILLAEDNRLTLTIMQRRFAKLGYDVISATNGKEAFALYEKHQTPLIVTDWEMPEMTGLELIKKIRDTEQGQYAYILLLTAKEKVEEIVEGLSCGADDYMKKTMNSDEMAVRIHAGQRIVELQQELSTQIDSLEKALDHIKQLQGILPICVHCKKIRSDSASWERIEQYISTHSEAKFSHSLCPACLAEHYPDVNIEKEK